MDGGRRATYTYDLFLSFRGEDTRMGFAGNLYNALDQRGIRTFFDDKEIRKGEELTPALVKAIEESRIAITVLSKNYAFSSFCLEELATILKCLKEKKVQAVLPVFYDVDPSDVRHQIKSYGEALAKHEDKFKEDKEKFNDIKEKFKFNKKMRKWKKALHNAANLSGFAYNHGDGYEYQLIWNILKEVSAKINRTLLHVAKYPVGLESRVHKVNSLLNVESDDVVCMVGIHGIGGIGKSTIARAVYNSISNHFEGLCCFLEDVRVNSVKYGLVHLQEMVLSVILRDNDTKLQNVNEGISTIKQRLQRKKVLLVLDGVDNIKQLEAIVGGVDWFGSGSRVIITTREERLLACHGIERTYGVEELSKKEALDLLSWNAFKTNKVDPVYRDILNRAVTYAFGLPLALEVIGSNLFGKREEECKLTLDRYDTTHDKEIQDILRVSFDSLHELEKKVFLDIACCFGGYKLSDVENILHAHHGSSMRPSITLLIEKSLIKIDDGLVTLHALIQDMGRAIVREESDEPGERSRLWFYEDVVQVLEENKGTSKIQILILDFPKDGVHLKGLEGKEVHWDGKAIKEMKNLKTLIIRNGHFSEGPTALPNSLRVLKWWKYPFPSLPNYFHPKRLSILELPDSFLKQCEPIQKFAYLTVLDFSYSEYVTEIPDVSGFRNLEKLSFKHCEKLTKIHESVGYLENLKILDAASCKNLNTFPPIILTSLEQLNLSHCSILESFPEILGKMEKITELHIMGSPIKELPISIQNLTRLRKIELQFCGMVQLPISIVKLPELGLICVSQCQGLQLSKVDRYEELESKSSNTECLILSQCNISNDFLPIGLTWFANVKDLNLSGNNFTILHACIIECHFLRNLKLDDCRSLQEIRGIPMKLETLSVKRCMSLKFLDLTVLPRCSGECHFLKELILDDCVYLKEIKGFLPNLDNFSAENCTSLTSSCTSMLQNQEWVEAGNKMFFLPGTKIPEWFTYSTRGGSLSFWFRKKFPAISICLVIGLVDEQPIMVKFSPLVFINGKKQSLGIQKVYEFRIGTDHMFLFDIQLLKIEDNMDAVFSDSNWNSVEVSYADHINNDEVQIRLVAKYSGIHVLKQTSGMEDIQFTKPEKAMKTMTLGSNLEGSRGRAKIMTKTPPKDQTMVLSSPVLTLIPPPPAQVPTPSNERSWEDVGGETPERLPEDEVHPTTVQNDPPVVERCREGNDVEVEAISSSELESEESSSNPTGSDSDDPFTWVDKKLCVSGKETISLGACSEDASLTSIREAIGALELLMIKDLSEVSSDPDMKSQFDHMLTLLNKSSHCKVTIQVKSALAEFRRKAFASFQEFQATVEPLSKLNNFEKQKARIQKETSAGKNKRKDLKNSMKKVSLAIMAKSSRKMELESEIANIRKQIATQEMDLEQLVLNVRNQEVAMSTYLKNRNSLDEQARALSKEADDLLAANKGVEDEGEAAEVKQNMLKSTWSTDLPSQLNKIKNNILGL